MICDTRKSVVSFVTRTLKAALLKRAAPPTILAPKSREAQDIFSFQRDPSQLYEVKVRLCASVERMPSGYY